MIRMSRKGVELPVNALIIIMLAVVVLAAALSIFTGVYNPGRETTTNIGSFNGACAEYSSAGCCDPQPPATCDKNAAAGNLDDYTGDEFHNTCCRSG